ncbi:Hypothetical protein NTJ_12833 [Nesidiocoris tenuis]|uniref:Proline-rich transmembrane protein 3/4 domain-containing protein n=1 Tax=Nesidiocoris tenuis TaxID=355587 RepID=A0ABN7B6I4_9HEMI|nr:Hypothetical protein NTJ_12833 [Nesidiocoris tenuis]
MTLQDLPSKDDNHGCSFCGYKAESPAIAYSTIEEFDLNLTRTTLIWPSRGSWPQVNKQVKWWLMLHAYGFAISFLVLAFYAFFSILNIRSLITSRPFMSTINVFLCVLSATRAIVLFIDPYALKDTMPRLLGFAIWDIGLPSLISAQALLLLALLHLTQLPVGPKFFKKKSCLSLIITLHFTCVLAVDMSLGLHVRIQVLKYLVETLFYGWGLTVCSLLLYSSTRAIRILSNMPSAMLERDIDDQYKGIMQLAMLAPYNNLATSVAAALVPTLLAPKLVHQKPHHGSGGNSNRGADPSSSTPKQEPMKSCILKTTPKPSPNSSDSEDARTGGENGPKRAKKLSWGPEKRIAAQAPKKGLQQQQSTSRSKSEDENEDANTTLLPPTTSKLEPDLTLDAILNHIAYMNRGGVSETTASRKSRLRNTLRLTALVPTLVFALIGLSSFRIITPQGWYSNYRSWLMYETICRILEVMIAWSIASLTKQPVSPSHRSASGPYHASKQSMFM